jgi:hypothetical protein
MTKSSSLAYGRRKDLPWQPPSASGATDHCASCNASSPNHGRRSVPDWRGACASSTAPPTARYTKPPDCTRNPTPIAASSELGQLRGRRRGTRTSSQVHTCQLREWQPNASAHSRIDVYISDRGNPRKAFVRSGPLLLSQREIPLARGGFKSRTEVKSDAPMGACSVH